MDEMDIEIRNNVMRVLVECRKEKRNHSGGACEILGF